MDKEFAEVYNLTYKKVGTFCLLHYNHILQPLNIECAYQLVSQSFRTHSFSLPTIIGVLG